MSKRVKDLEEIVEIISIAIARERASTQFYMDAYQKATNENTRKMFSLLIEQEKGHEAKLRAQLHEIRSEIEMEKMKSR